jgi:hypothetical protein
LRSADVGDPPSPTELQQRVEQNRSLAVKPESQESTTAILSTLPPPSDHASVFSDEQTSLNMVL